MKMIRIFILLVFCFVSIDGIFGQEFDFVLDPIDKVTSEPTMYGLRTGSWAVRIHETYPEREWILDNAERPVIMIFYGTATSLDNVWLSESVRNEYAADFTGRGTWGDENGHETLVAGCSVGHHPQMGIGTAEALVEKGLVVAIPVGTIGDSGGGKYEWIDEGLEYGFELVKRLRVELPGFEDAVGIHNISSGGSMDYEPLNKRISEVRESGDVVIISAGNSGGDPVLFPGRSDKGRGIAAIDESENRAGFSSYGDKVFLAGGGVRVLSTNNNNGFSEADGTSFSSPIIAGIYGVMLSCYPDATVNQVERMIVERSGKEWDKFLGFGIPKMSKLKNLKVGDFKDDFIDNYSGEDPGDDDDGIIKDERELVFELGANSLLWKPQTGKFKELSVEWMEVLVDSKKMAERTFDDVKEEVDWFFTRRAIISLNNDDFVDGGNWMMFFCEMLVNKRDVVDMKIKRMMVVDDQGRRSIIERERFSRMKMWVKNLRVDRAVSLEYNQN
jgi:hypothetical protein